MKMELSNTLEILRYKSLNINKMKVILSTKVLASTIKKAIALRCETFEYNPETKDLVFNDDPQVYIDIHIIDKEGIGREQFTFDTIQMFKFLTFVKELEEQPICVEFDQYEDDKLSIQLSQFVKRF